MLKPGNQILGYSVLAAGSAALLFVLLLGWSRHYGGGPLGTNAASGLEGEWDSTFKDYQAVLQLHAGTYQILALQPLRPGTARYYSRGTATSAGRLLTLTPDDALGVPESNDPAAPYTALTTQPYTVTIRQDGNQLIWTSGPRDPERSSFNPMHPLIQYSGADSISWTPRP